MVDACKPCNGEKGSLLLEEYRQVVAFRLKVNSKTYRFPGELRNVEPKAYQRQLKQQKNQRARRRASGMCMRCGRVPARPGRVDCLSCAGEVNKRESRKRAGMCASCGKIPPLSDRVNCETCAEKFRHYHQNNKRQCFDHYGRTCACCKQTLDERFLTLDHVNNDEAEHRDEIGHSSLYKWAIANAFPAILQTNCWNCNMGKSINGGVCPHQSR